MTYLVSRTQPGTRRTAMAVVVSAVILATACFGVVVAQAHEDGKIELWVSEASVEESPDGGVLMQVHLLDRDTGDDAPGFAVVFSATRDGADVTRGNLLESRPGVYEGAFDLEAGVWVVTVRADQGESPLPALKSDRVFEVRVDEAGGVEIVSGDSSGSTWLFIILAVAVAVAALGGALWLLARRRHRVQAGERQA